MRGGGKRRFGKKTAWFTAAGCAAGFHLPSASAALQPEDFFAVSAGPVILRPRVSLSEAFTDNVWYGDGRRIPKESDFITAIQPSLEAQLGHAGGLLEVTARYELSSVFYADKDQLNGVDHSLSLQGALSGAKLRLTSANSVNFRSTVSRGYERFLLEEWGYDTSIDRIYYSFSEKVDYELSSKTSLYGGGRFDGSSYSGWTPYYYDRFAWRAFGGAGWALFPRLKAVGEIDYGVESRSRNWKGSSLPDLSTLGGFIGVDGELTPKIRGRVKVGYETSEFSDGAEGVDSPAVDVGLSYNYSEKTSVTLSYSRRSRASVSSAHTAYLNNYVTLGVQQIVGSSHPVMLNLTARYGVNEYSGSSVYRGRSSTYYGVSLSAGYRLKSWLTAGGGYEFEHRSGVSWIDYDVNRIFVGMMAGF
ncbi:MAG: outer membrane beta-barrel protein [Verrucomicrobia bacterium]|nr:outer membrane beta-barrel protein [Verrucomicrobiota bacterium]